MAEELKLAEMPAEPDDELETAAGETVTEDNDADIDQYIRELTGKAEPEKEIKEEKAPEVEHFRVTSQIGEDDHKAFIYFSTLLRHKWTLPLFIILPIVFSIIFAFDNGEFYSGNLIVALVVLYVALALIVVFRCSRWMSKTKKNNPQAMHLTETTIVFLTYSIIHLKNEKRTKVEYFHMIGLGETKKRFYMYFDNGKSMVFRKEDMPQETFEQFRAFIQTKVHKRSLKEAIGR